MEIKEFEEVFYNLKSNPDMDLSIISAEDVKDFSKVKIIIDGKEIKSKVVYLICAEDGRE